MLRKMINFVVAFFKANVAFGLGVVVGSIIGTATTILITMGYYGMSGTLSMYTQTICGG